MPIARRRSAARPACRWRSTPTSRRTRSRSCRCSRSGPRSSSCATRSRPTCKRHTMAVYDDTAAIGKLYRRQDEIGTPWCVTVDVDSLEDGAVTVRDRDSMTQERVPVEGVTRLILDRLDAARNAESGGDWRPSRACAWRSWRGSPRSMLASGRGPTFPFASDERVRLAVHAWAARRSGPRRHGRATSGDAALGRSSRAAMSARGAAEVRRDHRPGDRSSAAIERAAGRADVAAAGPGALLVRGVR